MAFRSSAKVANTGGSVTATPAGVVANDILLAVGAIDRTPGYTTVGVPSGWASPVYFDQGGPDGHQFWYSYKLAAAGGGADSFTFTNGDISAEASLFCAAFSGRDNSALSATPVTTNDTNANSSPVAAILSGITATAGDDIALFVMGDQTSGDGRWNATPPIGYTEREDGVNEDWISLGALDTRDNVSAGATGSLAKVLTLTSGSGDVGYAGVVFALKSSGGGGGGGIEGTLSATEAGDTLSSTSTIQIKGVVSVTEAGDTLSATGVITLSGTASLTEGGDTLSATGRVALVGTLSATEAGDTLVSTGQGGSTGSLSVTEDDDTLASAGVLLTHGTASITEAGDTVVASGTISLSGTLSVTEGGDTLAAVAALALQAALAVTEEGDTLEATGDVEDGSRTGSLAVVEADDTVVSTATISLSGTLSVTEDGDSLTATGSTSGYLIDGDLSYQITAPYGSVTLYNNGTERYFKIGLTT